ncbi:hypothetical protein SAMN02194393_03894 [Maledivibacter halophilus]|uniref:Uncharacterized protein n=1 Tax=Maledivibacter halophilus TaxID=36842 RepID=A0A1T5M5F6_9FIRM|nr:hypothetical protein SAMN02194393_03894 [Maledivibacter halophilus]
MKFKKALVIMLVTGILSASLGLVAMADIAEPRPWSVDPVETIILEK